MGKMMTESSLIDLEAGPRGHRAATGVVIAIDGGNSKTDVAIVALNGDVIARTRSGGVSAHVLGVNDAVAELNELVTQALRDAERLVGPITPIHTGAYLAGVDLDRERFQMAAAIERRGWSPTTRVDNDTFALLRLGSPSGDGIAVVCGAGINCVGVSREQIVRFPSLGAISGDWGGGGQLGLAAVTAVARAGDRRGPATILSAAVLSHFGIPDTGVLIERLHFGDLARARLAELSPIVFEAASNDDAVAQSLVERLAGEIASFVTATTIRLGGAENHNPIILGGSILATQWHALRPFVSPAVSAVIPHPQFVIFEDRPIDGAVLLALDEVSSRHSTI